MPLRVDRELLAERELEAGLVLAAPEQSEEAAEDCDRSESQGPHRREPYSCSSGCDGSPNLASVRATLWERAQGSAVNLSRISQDEY